MTPGRRLMGVDYGSARIGIAISDELQMLAHPFETIKLGRVEDALNRVATVAQEKDVAEIVVGLPRNMDGSSGAAAEQARAFAEKLGKKTTARIVLWDERLTTVAANRAMQEVGKRVRESRAFIDQVAAQFILQGYLDSRAGNPPLLETPE